MKYSYIFCITFLTAFFSASEPSTRWTTPPDIKFEVPMNALLWSNILCIDENVEREINWISSTTTLLSLHLNLRRLPSNVHGIIGADVAVPVNSYA